MMARKGKKKRHAERTTYMGGEWDSPEKVTPKRYESFLNEKWLFGTLAMLVIFTVILALVMP